MKKNWVKIYSTNKRHEAEIAKGVLKEHGISAVMIDKQDSSYVVIGEIEIYAHRDEALKAINLLNKQSL